MRTGLAIVIAVAVGLSPGAHAQSSEAERLFNEGLALSDKGRFAEACARFEESIARDPRQLGALLNLARCNEQQGKIATAIKYYKAAREQAIEAGKEGSRNRAEGKINELEPDVPRVTFVRQREAYPGEKLVFDDVVVSVTEQLSPDPGEHALTLTAPGRLPHETKVTLGKGERRTLELPELELPRNKVTTRVKSSRKLVGKSLAIGGASVAVASSLLAYLVKRDYDALFDGATPHCGLRPDIGGKPACDDYGSTISSRDRKLFTSGIVGIGVGVALAAAGVVLWTTAPEDSSRTRIVPDVDSDGASVMIEREIRW